MYHGNTTRYTYEYLVQLYVTFCTRTQHAYEWKRLGGYAYKLYKYEYCTFNMEYGVVWYRTYYDTYVYLSYQSPPDASPWINSHFNTRGNCMYL